MSYSDNCGRIAVRVQRIFNGATLLTRGVFSSELSGFSPAVYTAPLTYVSAVGTGDAEITAFTVTPVAGSSRSRLTLAFSYDVTVSYIDAAGAAGKATARISDAADLLVTVPDRPYTVSASVDFASAIGTITLPRADITACRRLNVKLLVPCDILICAAGDVKLPEADAVEDAVCRRLS